MGLVPGSLRYSRPAPLGRSHPEGHVPKAIAMPWDGTLSIASEYLAGGLRESRDVRPRHENWGVEPQSSFPRWVCIGGCSCSYERNETELLFIESYRSGAVQGINTMMDVARFDRRRSEHPL